MVPYEKIVAEDLNLGVDQVALTAPAGGLMPGTQVNLATFGLGVSQAAQGTVAAGSANSFIVAVPGAKTGAMVLVSHSGSPAGLIWSGNVTAQDQVTVAAFNGTAAGVSYTGTLRVVAFIIP